MGESYLFDSSKGMLLVAYPNPGVDTTEFEFTYWTAETPFDPTPIIIAVVVIVVLCIAFIIFKIYKKRQRDKNMV